MVLDQLKSAVSEVEAADEVDIDPKELSSLVDRLQVKFSKVIHHASERGDHLVMGNISASGWVANTCGMSRNSAGDRLCVGKEIESMPEIEKRSEERRVGKR